jgi:hypothetical protein
VDGEMEWECDGRDEAESSSQMGKMNGSGCGSLRSRRRMWKIWILMSWRRSMIW